MLNIMRPFGPLSGLFRWLSILGSEFEIRFRASLTGLGHIGSNLADFPSSGLLPSESNCYSPTVNQTAAAPGNHESDSNGTPDKRSHSRTIAKMRSDSAPTTFKRLASARSNKAM